MTRVFLKSVQILVLLSLVFAVGCKKDKDDDNGGGGTNQPPTCNITNPQNDTQFGMDEDITVTVVAEDADGTIDNVELYVDGVKYSEKNALPYNFIINAGELALGAHILKAVAKDNKGDTGEATVNIIVFEMEPTLAVGDPYQGGIIAYLDETGKHGFIAASEDQSDGIKWLSRGSFLETGADGIKIGTGQDNTTKIAQAQAHLEDDDAARLCYNLVLNGYDDWFLPSLDELDELYKNKDLIGGFGGGWYWSSSENSSHGAWAQRFNDGEQGACMKSDSYSVRAVRYF